MPRQRRKKSDKTPLLLSVLIVLGILSFLGYVALNPAKETLGNGCLVDPVSTSSSLTILLDTSDEYRPVQLQIIKNILFERVSRLDTFDQLKVYRVDELTDGILKATINLCKPEENDMEAPLFAKLKKAQFKAIVQSAFEVARGSQPTSPLIESIASVASDLNPIHKSAEIIVVSDLIENSESISMYPPDWKGRLERNPLYLEKIRPSLKGAEIRLLMLSRPEIESQNLALKKWWISFLRTSGSPLVELEEIRG